MYRPPRRRAFLSKTVSWARELTALAISEDFGFTILPAVEGTEPFPVFLAGRRRSAMVTVRAIALKFTVPNRSPIILTNSRPAQNEQYNRNADSSSLAPMPQAHCGTSTGIAYTTDRGNYTRSCSVPIRD